MNTLHPRDTHELTRILAHLPADSRFVYGTEKPGTNIDLCDAPELKVIRQNCCSLASLTIGCAANPAQVAAHPLIRHYYPAMAHACTQLLERDPQAIAVGASIFAREPDLWAAMLALDCKALIMDPDRNIRSIPMHTLFDSEGRPQLNQQEVVTGFNLPRPRFTHCACSHAVTADGDLHLAIFLHIEDEGIAIARIVLALPDRPPVFCLHTAQQLIGWEADEYPAAQLCDTLCRECAGFGIHLPTELILQVWNSLDCVF